jgi:hypothetical protein
MTISGIELINLLADAASSFFASSGVKGRNLRLARARILPPHQDGRCCHTKKPRSLLAARLEQKSSTAFSTAMPLSMAANASADTTDDFRVVSTA